MVNNFLKKWVIPPGISEIISNVKNSGAANNITSLGEQNKKFYNIHKGERCFICATGPSIKMQDLSVLKDDICFGVSHFFLHEQIDIIKPKYYVLAPYHEPFGFTDIERIFKGFAEEPFQDTTYFFGHNNYKESIHNYINHKPVFTPSDYYYLDYTHSGSLGEENWTEEATWDITKSPFQPRTVIYSVIQLAAYMGFSKIYLLGCDHDYLADFTRVTNHHFYKEEEGASDVELLGGFSTERWFLEYYSRWRDYRLFQTYLKERGSEIINATEGGYLDSFPRADLKTLF